MSAETIIAGGRPGPGPQAGTVLVFETPADGVSLQRRIDAHAALLRKLAELLAVPNDLGHPVQRVPSAKDQQRSGCEGEADHALPAALENLVHDLIRLSGRDPESVPGARSPPEPRAASATRGLPPVLTYGGPMAAPTSDAAAKGSAAANLSTSEADTVGRCDSVGSDETSVRCTGGTT